MASSLAATAVAFASSALTTFVLYPYRDFVKLFSLNGSMKMDYVEFCLSRYRGMATHPSQPLLLATPAAALYGGYVLGGGGVTGALVGGVLCGNVKAAVRTTARRMSGAGSWYNERDHRSYSSLLDCIRCSGRHYGPLSFFSGGVAMSCIAILWHGTALGVLQQSHSQTFGQNFWEALRIHSLMTFFTAPIRNTFRSALASGERSGGVKTVADYVTGEVAVFREAGGVFRHVLRSEGIPFFFSGAFRTVFKTSVPFALTYALFRSFGGSIGHPTRSSYGGYGRHGGRFMRHA